MSFKRSGQGLERALKDPLSDSPGRENPLVLVYWVMCLRVLLVRTAA